MAKNSVLILVFLLGLCACASGPETTYNQGVEQYAMGHVESCIKEYRQAIVLHPEDPRPKFNLAVIYQDQGRLEEAENLYREITRQDPGFSAAWSNLAAIAEKRGGISEAQKLHLRAMQADGGSCALASQFGFFLLRQGQSIQAGKVFEKSVQKEPRCANSWFGLGLLAEAKGDLPAALRDYDKDSIYNPDDVEAYLRSADILISRGDTQRA
jgi:Tfp pilus assembly protein PilF